MKLWFVLVQDWKMRHEPLVEMHGNNGSIDGDPAPRCVIRKLVYQLFQDCY